MTPDLQKEQISLGVERGGVGWMGCWLVLGFVKRGGGGMLGGMLYVGQLLGQSRLLGSLDLILKFVLIFCQKLVTLG